MRNITVSKSQSSYSNRNHQSTTFCRFLKEANLEAPAPRAAFMSDAFALAWSVLKAAIRPRSLAEQIGAGTFATAYGREGEPDVTKLGKRPLTELMMQHALSEIYPDLVVPEAPARLPGGYGEGIPPWMLYPAEQVEDKQVVIPDMQEHQFRRKFPMPVTQTRGEPRELEDALRLGGKNWRRQQDELWSQYPALGGFGITDLEAKNWARMPGSEQDHIIDLLTSYERPKPIEAIQRNLSEGVMPEATPPVRRDIQEAWSALPDIDDLVEPWMQDIAQSPHQIELEQELQRRMSSTEGNLGNLQQALERMAYL